MTQPKPMPVEILQAIAQGQWVSVSATIVGDPQFAVAYPNWLAWLYFKAYERELSVQALADCSAEDELTAVTRAGWLARDGQLQAALELLVPWLGKREAFVAAALASELCLAAHDLENALQLAIRAQTFLLTQAEALSMRSACLLRKGHPAEAETLLATALQHYPEHPSLLMCQAQMAMLDQRWEQAASCWSQLIRLVPAWRDAYINASECYRRARNFESVVQCAEQGLARFPGDFKLSLNLATTWVQMRRYDRGVPMLKELLQRHPDQAILHNNLGGIYLANGRYQEALEAFSAAQRLSPNSAEIAANLARVWQALGDFEQAEQYLDLALSVEPTQLDLLRLKARQAVLRADYASALAILHQIEVHGASRFDDALQEADALWRQGEIDAARHVFKQALRAAESPTHPANAEVIALVPIGRSGSLFFQSLVDGHPDLAVIPGVFLKGFFNGEVWAGLTTALPADWQRELAARFCQTYAALFDASLANPVPGNPFSSAFDVGRNCGLTTLGAGSDQVLKVDAEQYARLLTEELSALTEPEPGAVFVALHRAWHRLWGQKAERQGIFYHIHNPDLSERVMTSIFLPRTRWLLIVREPLQALESWLFGIAASLFDKASATPQEIRKAYQDMAGRLAGMLWGPFQFGLLDAPTAYIRLEDVKRHSDATMARFAEWAGIEMSPLLLESTVCGMAYSGPPSKANPGIRGFDQSNLNRTSGYFFSDKDRRRLAELFAPHRLLFGYEANGQWQDAVATVQSGLGSIDEPFDFELKLEQLSGTAVVASPRFIALRNGLRSYCQFVSKLTTRPVMDAIRPQQTEVCQ